MTRAKSIAIGLAVMIAVVAATTALALNAGFVTESAATVDTADIPVTTTTTYEQYLEEWYAANPTTTGPAPAATGTPEPIIVYEYVDVPVTVPPPQIIYVTVPPTESPTSTIRDSREMPSTTVTAPSRSAPPTTQTPTTAPPAMELLEFDMYGFADVTIASNGPGDSLQFWQIEQDSPWVWEIEEDNGPRVEVKFFNTSSGTEAKLQLEIRDNGYRLKTEGDGFSEREVNL